MVTLMRDPRDDDTSDYMYDCCENCGAEVIVNIFDDSPSLCADCIAQSVDEMGF